MTRVTLALVFVALAGTAQAAPTPAPFKPHYVSQRTSQAYMREGPSFDHKVLWAYRHKGYPFLLLASFDVWRRVQDLDGTVGWMSAQMLSDSRTVLVTGKGRAPLHDSADSKTKVVGLADPGAILGLKACLRDACRVYSEGIDGWIAKNRIWGVDAGEVFK